MNITAKHFYFSYRGFSVAAVLGGSLLAGQAYAVGMAEKEDLTFGFIKLTDMAPLAIAYEKGFFEDEGLFSAEHLQSVIEEYNSRGQNFNLGMVYPVSTHNYELRYWLAAGGIHPGYYAPQRDDTAGTLNADVHISVTPPPQMPATLDAGTIHGYCVGEPWNQQAVFRDIVVPVITDYDIRNNIAEKVFGVSNEWAEANPNTHLRVVKALIRAGHWLDEYVHQVKIIGC